MARRIFLGDGVPTALKKLAEGQQELISALAVAGISPSQISDLQAAIVAALSPGLSVQSGSFTPTFSFETPGDLSVAYSTQFGVYRRMGDLVWVNTRLVFTPTYITSSGLARFGGLPFTVSAETLNNAGDFSTGSSIVFPAGTTDAAFLFLSGTTLSAISSFGSGVSGTQWGLTQFPTGASTVIPFTGWYVTTDPMP